MAVITRFIVVRNGVELDKVFDVKKEADAYDKMLDAAENLAVFIKKSDLQIDLDAKTVEEISIYLAKNAPEVTNILRGIKPITPSEAKIKKRGRLSSFYQKQLAQEAVARLPGVTQVVNETEVAV